MGHAICRVPLPSGSEREREFRFANRAELVRTLCENEDGETGFTAPPVLRPPSARQLQHFSPRVATRDGGCRHLSSLPPNCSPRPCRFYVWSRALRQTCL